LTVKAFDYTAAAELFARPLVGYRRKPKAMTYRRFQTATMRP
jgi:hypothetical protein